MLPENIEVGQLCLQIISINPNTEIAIKTFLYLCEK